MTNEHSDQPALSSEAHSLPKGVHLVGSVPLSSAEEVFRTTSAILGERLRRIPDGETGVRHNWISWQRELFESHPLFEQTPPDSNAYGPRSFFKLRSQVSPGEIRFDRLGYADVAKVSYVTFASLKQAGVISASVHFLVCLPTPLAPVTVFVAPSDRAIVEPSYEAAMLNELQQICAAIPHNQLAIQWDTAVEFGILEGVTPSPFTTPKTEIVGRLLRLGASVPADVALGYHLCYGDAGHKHFKEPEDTFKLVEIANAVAADLTRPLNWIHLPVPRNRSDDAYFAPLKQLQLHPETELYLGLVHFTDGVEGTLKRIQAAKQFVTDFGVATECGFGRRPPDTIPALLRIQSQVAEPV